MAEIMTWLTPSIFIQILIGIIIFFVGWNLKIMLAHFSTTIDDVKTNITTQNKILIDHVKDFSIHKG